MIEGQVRYVHVLAEFSCDRKCGGVALRMTRAPLKSDGTIGQGERPKPCVCNACERKDRDRDEAERKKKANQRAWARKHSVKEPSRGK